MLFSWSCEHLPDTLCLTFPIYVMRVFRKLLLLFFLIHNRLINTAVYQLSILSVLSILCKYRGQNCIVPLRPHTKHTCGCDFCRARCERRINLTVLFLKVPGYVCKGTYRTATGSSPRMHGNIEPGLKGQRGTAMQSEQLAVDLNLLNFMTEREHP